MVDGRVLLLTGYDGTRAGAGREGLSRLIETVLADLAGSLEVMRLAGRTAPLDGLRGRLGGLDGAAAAELRARVADPATAVLVCDGSQLGGAAALARAAQPDLPIITFCHNCETQFFADALRAAPGLKAAGVLAGHWQAERLAMRHSTQVVTLSQRDSAELVRRFGRGGERIVPLALEDARDPAAVPSVPGEPYALFVGGGFFGNLEGLRWYARAVAPSLAIRTLVVGRGLEGLGPLPANIELVGPVDDLSPWYAGAALVVAPILSGSGMKTKVAEALMHGKRVVGTAEGFAGYDAAVVAANHLCDDPQDFAAAINAALAQPPPAFDPAMRALYEARHSRTAFRDGLAAVLADYDPVTSR
ncbi:MAG: glycosyltransferase family 4 protein [Erythrobacter sp.]|uniref:glycosyltransferase n=1 Tax=Erythrobacter sp. TaxID=1042 RepID=UPI0025DD8251|nr:glycosyltransferase family 4 protein [Erythrobacter sp.]MCL9998117.1 glycosyltransferase family 4 protein [Erythrobacter sp.]